VIFRKLSENAVKIVPAARGFPLSAAARGRKGIAAQNSRRRRRYRPDYSNIRTTTRSTDRSADEYVAVRGRRARAAGVGVHYRV